MLPKKPTWYIRPGVPYTRNVAYDIKNARAGYIHIEGAQGIKHATYGAYEYIERICCVGYFGHTEHRLRRQRMHLMCPVYLASNATYVVYVDYVVGVSYVA